MAAWNIYEADGRYVGKHASTSPTVAFCEYMALYEPRPCETDLRLEALGDGSDRITYGERVYILRESEQTCAVNTHG